MVSVNNKNGLKKTNVFLLGSSIILFLLTFESFTHQICYVNTSDICHLSPENTTLI